jgi:type I restriction enzyme R subunit
MTADLMQDVKDDKAAMNNINASLKKKDIQNAQITFTDILKEKMINHIDSNFEVFKEYNDNPEFRAFLAGQMFNLMLKDFSARPTI